jgi:DNA replication protein DnaC
MARRQEAMMKKIQDNDAKMRILNLAKMLRVPDLANFEDVVDSNATFIENFERVLKNAVQLRQAKSLSRRLGIACLMPDKNFDTFVINNETLPGVDKENIELLMNCSFINDKEDVVLIGPAGRGKTHLANAIGIEAIKKGFKVKFVVADKLLTSLREARDGLTLQSLTESLFKHDLLIIDEVGYFSYSSDESNMLFRVISSRHDKSSTIVTTNCQFSDWTGFVTEPNLLRALIDRLVEKSNIINMNSKKSYRYKNAKSRRTGVQTADVEGI